MDPTEKLDLALGLPENERVILAIQMSEAASVAAAEALGEAGWAEAWASEVERRLVEADIAPELGADDDLLGLLFDADALGS
jgi:hypothetical protein